MRHRHGFTLVELSIVLVILGLLIGGVLTGQSLIRAAELRSVSADYSRYAAAVNSFRDKYFALPGDINNAQTFWGVAHATPATCITTASTTTATCNGDGNGQVHATASGSSNEIYRFWQHLANARLIEGQYDGITHGSTTVSSTTDNSPRGKIATSLWTAQWRGTVSGGVDLFYSDYGNTFALGGVAANTIAYSPIFKPEELWNIDTKIDDGRPAQGNVVLFGYGNVTTCTNAASNSDLTATYSLNVSSISCSIMFRRQF